MQATKARTHERRLLEQCVYGFIIALSLLAAGCGSSDPVEPSSNLDLSREFAPALMVSQDQLRRWQAEIDNYNGGFRPAGSPEEIAYTERLASQLRSMGIEDVRLEPYAVKRWVADRSALDLLGDAPQSVALAGYIPFSGDTGPEGLERQVVYLPGLAAVNLEGLLLDLLNRPGSAGLQALLEQVLALPGDGLAGLSAIVGAITAADVQDKIVLYDLPKAALTLGALEAVALHVNDANDTMGLTTPYSRPFVDMVVAQLITTALKLAGAAGAIGIIGYPPAAANGSYYPFFLRDLPSLPTLYLDRDTGAALKARLAEPLGGAVRARLTLDALEEDATAYNLTAIIPGQTPQEILLSSHTDGTNSIEDNGPAAILGIARYFTRVPVAQRPRSLRIVFGGGHFGGGGLHQYVEEHLGELSSKVLVAIEIEHIGAREWLEIAPGVMGLTGLNEPQVLMTPLDAPFQRESALFADQFDRSIVLPPLLPFGEGQIYRNEGGLPMIQYITGPVYLLNYGIPQVTTQYTDYALMHSQTAAFVRMVLNLASDPMVN